MRRRPRRAALARSRAQLPARRAPRFTARVVPPLASQGWPAWRAAVEEPRGGPPCGSGTQCGHRHGGGRRGAARALTGGQQPDAARDRGMDDGAVGGLPLRARTPSGIRNDLRTDLARLAVLRKGFPARRRRGGRRNGRLDRRAHGAATRSCGPGLDRALGWWSGRAVDRGADGRPGGRRGAAARRQFPGNADSERRGHPASRLGESRV